ncbi:MAG: hypothetical protein DRP01_04265 [Archaeoglobales archaeon]|nr:MAG: hypothetical protein DRP01_04265 [Archaeoglobales archaeon]
MVFFKYFSVSGQANKEKLDDGLQSTAAEKKRLISVLIQVDGYANNKIVGYHETTKVFEIPDSLIDTPANTGSTNQQYSFNRLNEIPVGIDMPVGTTFKVGIVCGATAKNITGAYMYEVIE